MKGRERERERERNNDRERERDIGKYKNKRKMQDKREIHRLNTQMDGQMEGRWMDKLTND